jgi:hypothetical protein
VRDVGRKTARSIHFLKANGIAALEARFEEYQIDIFDINRTSAV